VRGRRREVGKGGFGKGVIRKEGDWKMGFAEKVYVSCKLKDDENPVQLTLLLSVQNQGYSHDSHCYSSQEVLQCLNMREGHEVTIHKKTTKHRG